MTLKLLLLVGMGGACGAMARYALQLLVQQYYPGSFPLGTFLVNITGCFLIGAIIALADKQQLMGMETKILLTTGFCGGFTTFSAFAIESIALLQNGKILPAMLYITASVCAGILATWAGLQIAR